MKMLTPVSVALIYLLILTRGTPAPLFPDVRILVPPLALIENARQGLRPIFNEDSPGAFGEARPAPRPPARLSRMPIITPTDDVHYYMRIQKPDESVDYKLRVKIPEVRSAQ